MDIYGKFTKVLENMRKGIEGSIYIEKDGPWKERRRKRRIIIIRNGAKTLSLQTLFGRLNEKMQYNRKHAKLFIHRIQEHCMYFLNLHYKICITKLLNTHHTRKSTIRTNMMPVYCIFSLSLPNKVWRLNVFAPFLIIIILLFLLLSFHGP
jgi:hypothetical protein